MSAPTFDSDPYAGLTLFQRDHVQSLLMHPNFSHFVLIDGDLAKTFQLKTPGPKNVLWYDKAGGLWLDRIGQRKLLVRIAPTAETNQ